MGKFPTWYRIHSFASVHFMRVSPDNMAGQSLVISNYLRSYVLADFVFSQDDLCEKAKKIFSNYSPPLR